MEIVGDYEYSGRDLIGHGAFAVVFKGRLRNVSSTYLRCIADLKLLRARQSTIVFCLFED